METSQTVLSVNTENDIHSLALYIERHIEENWQTIFHDVHGKMVDLYDEIGEGVYGLYGQRLFKPIHEQFKQAGLRSTPRLPFGNLSTSREWGPEEERQRWFWSKITFTEGTEGAPIGTIVIIFFHDHNQIRVPRPCGVIALEETTKEAVVEALSGLSADFGGALTAKEEYAQYLAQYG